MSIPLNFTYQKEQHNVRLELVDKLTEKTLSIGGRDYKILGSDKDVSLLKSHIASLKTSEFESVSSFEATLVEIGPQEKINSVFQKTLAPSSTSHTEIESSGKIEALKEKEAFNVHDSVEKACSLLETYYIFPDKAQEGIQKIREKLREGHYDNIKDFNTFSVVFTKDLQEIIKDKHFDIVILLNTEGAQLSEDEVLKELEELNFGLDVVKTSENVGYLKIHQFHGVDFSGRDYVSPKIAQKTREAFDKAIDTMRGSDAIIIDMRENGGGSPYTVQFFSSYFLQEQIPLNTIRSREKDKESIQEFNTLSYEELPKSKRMLEAPLYILTSEATFSAAEEFTYDMRALGRGESIGETTGGGANPAHLKPLNNEGIYIAIPDEEAINPYTKTNWEGSGISPTHPVSADQALNKANELIKIIQSNKKE